MNSQGVKNNNNANPRGNNETGDTNEPRTGGIKEFIAQTTMIGNVIAAAASQKNSSEPLPFTDYSLFDENYDASKLAININPHAQTKYVFLPKTPIYVSISAERKHGAHIFHPYIYTLKFKHASYSWEAVRSYKEIKDVHKTLAKIVKQDLGKSCSDISKDSIKPDWPEFPTEHDHLVTASQIDDRCKKLAEYLQRLLTYPPYRDHREVLSLLGVSPLSFVDGLGKSLVEDILHKRTGDNVYYGHLSQLKICCEKAKIFFAKRWFVIKDTYIVYLNMEHNDSVGFVMLLDRGFKIKMGIRAGAYHGIQIKNLQRTLVLKCKNAQQQNEWYEKIVYMMKDTGKFFYNEDLLPYGSYAPARSNQMCRWYVNSAAYMEHVMHGLNNAKEEIYITDWWLCPELFLKRPTDDLQYRLDKILLKKAKEGVKVYILLFKEVTFALGLLSSRAKNILTQAGKNTNIKVLRHPEHTPSGVFLWSHHEKCVIIDQSVAFMGGIDLCFGRWDDDMHRLIDLGRKENILEIDESEIERPMQSLSIINEMNKMDLENQVDSAINEIRSTIERTDTEQKLDAEKSLEKELAEAQLNQLKRQKKQQFEQSQRNSQMKSEALIVAALMGNTTRLSKNFSSKSHQPVSAVNSISSPVFVGDTSSTLDTINKQTNENNKAQSPTNNRTQFELTSIKQNDALVEGFKPTNISLTTNNTNSNNYRSNFTNSRISGSSKALKYINVPTEDLDGPDENAPSKKKMVRRKWNQLKQTVKRRSQQNPLNRLRRKSVESEFDEDYESDEDDNEKNLIEQQPELPVVSNEGYYWIGKDYSNTYNADFKDVSDFSSDQFDRTLVPRMPWRDEGLVIFGDSARDLARHFIQRWNQCKREKVKQVETYPFLLPKSYSEPYNYNYQDWFKDQLFKCNVQLTRSLDSWSCGVCETEASICNAYCDLIRNAEHYIYIENQFFVTTTDPEKDLDVKNRIGLELVNRIKKAHEKQQKFRIYVVLPLLPGFDSFNAIQAVQYYNLRSIRLGEYSIYKELKKAGINDPSEYITFHGMRNWSVLMGKLVQEIIYVHSKLMIVDDKYVICGSANINDRSLLGKRDSEIAAIVKDEEFVNSRLNNTKVQAGKYAFSLRQKIFKLHLGIYFNNPDRIDISDCVSDEVYNYFRKVSNLNTQIYDEVFKCLPSDNVLNFDDLRNYPTRSCLKKTNPKMGKQKLDDIKGFIVDFPLLFLSQEKNFFPEINTPEGMVPIVMWT